MVFTSAVQLAKRAGLDQYWKKRRIFRLSAHYYGRARNCYVLAIRAVHRSLAFATKARKFKKEDMAQLWETRIAAGSEQHGVKYPHLREGLHRCNIHLNRKTLADLAIWEPYTFRALTQIAWTKMRQDGDREVKEMDGIPPNNVVVPSSKN